MFTVYLLVWLRGTEIMKILIPVILCYGNNNVCLGRWVLCALLLLKIIFSMKRVIRRFWMNEGWFMCVDTLKNYF